MKLTLKNGEIALPKDFAFQIQQNHPFFSQEGSKSVPATLPASSDNMKILGNPADINRSKRFVRQYEASLQLGSYFRRCRMVVDSGHTLDGIDMSLALDESEAYAELQDKKLRDILSDASFSVARTSVWSVFTSSTRRDAVFFPVAVDVDGSGSSASVGVLNKINESENGFVSAARSISHGDGTISVPDGYGLTCFLRLPELINRIFNTCGYSVHTNVFTSDPDLKDLVLLNNCADAMNSWTYNGTTWRVRYSDILPDITVGELITWLHDKFGAFVTVSEKRVDIRLFRDACNSTPDADLTAYMDGDARPTVSYPEPKTLIISVDTGLEGAAPAAESLEKLHSSYRYMNEVETSADINGNGLFFVKRLGKYYYRNTNWSAATLIGTNAYAYKRTTDVKEAEEIKPADVFPPMVYHTGQGIHMPYVGDSIRRNIDSDDTDREASQSLMVCYAQFNGTLGRWSGSPYMYDEDGGYYVGSNRGLFPEQLYASFWKEYHRMLIDGAPEVHCTLNLPAEVLFSMDIWTPKLFHGMKVLIKSMEYTLSDFRKITAELTLQTIPSYTDAISIPEPPSFEQALGWQRAVDDDESDLPTAYPTDYEVVEWDGLTNYSASDAPSWTPSYLGQTTMARQRWFRYEETYQANPTGHYGIHYYTEYFVAVYSGGNN